MMIKFKVTCPDCGAVVITKSPQAIIWELCPSCWRHIWDGYDALMADVDLPRESGCVKHSHANN